MSDRRRDLKPLARRLFAGDVAAVARALLGARLVRQLDDGVLVGRIVETEAYLAADDPASHSFRGLTPRNASMFGPPGHAYVYTIHAKFCFNVVTEPRGVASAVLVRAVEPVEGIETMRRLRGREKLRELTRGPARLCQALAIDRSLDGVDLTRRGALWIADGDKTIDAARIRVTPRIGISAAQEAPLRFIDANSPLVSGTRRQNGS